MKKRALLKVLLVLLVSIVAIEFLMHPFGRLINDLVFDNQVHYVPCSELPNFAEVDQKLRENKEKVKQIQNLGPNISVESGDVGQGKGCIDKADILIRYGSHEDRLKIMSLLKNWGEVKTLFGVPYRLING